MSITSTIARGATAVVAAGLLSVGFATASSAEPNEDNSNHPAFWEAALTEEGFVNVECSKDDKSRDTDTWISDGDYLAVILKAGSGPQENTVFGYDEENDEWIGVEKGDELTTITEKDISHIITCTADTEDEPENPGEPEEPGGPIVETDIVESGSNTPALLGGAAALAGLGLAGAAAARRKGQI